MYLSRRDFLKQAVGTGIALCSLTSLAKTTASSHQEMILYSAAMDKQGNYLAIAMSEKGELLFKTPLPARAHAMLIRPQQKEVLVFSRRPGYFLMVLDAETGALLQKIDSKDNRPLCGHGTFSEDGNTLYLTANDTDQQHGVIRVLDANNQYKLINEFSSGGIGPHEIRLLRDNKTLVVASGGILTHPESGRSKLNLDSMTPALTYLDAQQGHVLKDYRLAAKYHQLSIRHLDVNQQDTVCFAMQYQGSRQHRFPLIGFHRQGQSTLQLTKTPSTLLSAMKNYCGSVCSDPSGQHFAVSSPRGNLMTLWNDQGNFIASKKLNDGCGVAAGKVDNSFYLSSGRGEIHYKTKQQDRLIKRFEDYHWDNHLLSHHRS
ncbi:MAG: DUF1513 domain-containing protein [Cocleimonas sp.]|nr:DUF1513 domain-containing protein [Cocleimonas sp.]